MIFVYKVIWLYTLQLIFILILPDLFVKLIITFSSVKCIN